MKYAADFRELARNALRGKWGIAVIVGLVAVLLGGAGNEGPEINLNIEGGNANLGFEIAGQTIFSTGGGLTPTLGPSSREAPSISCWQHWSLPPSICSWAV